ncbi:unnamed protein product [Paramecium sonneborni]|uniref:Uncharacterized protein n=1 Tax=Paramecium sonneborni TaxID=65129 RepID=A0A8S1RX19_9CILI|nr:unnamed protein product [Paramecium sonneborni]
MCNGESVKLGTDRCIESNSFQHQVQNNRFNKIVLNNILLQFSDDMLQSHSDEAHSQSQTQSTAIHFQILLIRITSLSQILFDLQ